MTSLPPKSSIFPARKLSTCGNFQDPVHVVAIAFPWPRFERLSANFYRSSTALDAILRDLRLECAPHLLPIEYLFKTRPNISIHAECTICLEEISLSLSTPDFHARFLPRLPFSSTGRELRTAAEKEINREEEREREWFLHALFTAESFYSPTTGIVAGNKDINRGSRGTIQGLPFQEAGQFEQTFGEVIYALRTIIIEAPHENASTYLSFVSGRATRLEKPAGSVLMLVGMENIVFPLLWIFVFRNDV